MIYLAHAEVAFGETSPVALLAWCSHRLRRVTRSTFSAETMSCAHALDSAELLRARLFEVLHPGVDVTDGDLVAETSAIPILAITDCKSLYDTIHKEGSKPPAEKRLLIDLTWIRELMAHEVGFDDDVRCPPRWVPTYLQRGDELTKVVPEAKVKLHFTLSSPVLVVPTLEELSVLAKKYDNEKNKYNE